MYTVADVMKHKTREQSRTFAVQIKRKTAYFDTLFLKVQRWSVEEPGLAVQQIAVTWAHCAAIWIQTLAVYQTRDRVMMDSVMMELAVQKTTRRTVVN